MIAIVKRSQDNEEKSQKIVVTINAPIFVQRSPTCNIQWEKSTYSTFGDTWDSFAPTDRKLFALNGVDKETITLHVRISTLFICPVRIEAFATISSMSYICHICYH